MSRNSAEESVEEQVTDALRAIVALLEEMLAELRAIREQAR